MSILQKTIDLNIRAEKVTEVEPAYLGGATSLGVKVKLQDVRVEDII